MMKKLFLFLGTVLLVGLTAQAMLTEPVTFQGLKQTVNNTSYFSWQIRSVWGQASLANRQGTSYTFNNTNLSNWNPVSATVNGTLNFQEATAMTDVVTSGTFTVIFTCPTLWFDGATVKTGSGSAVTGCTAQVSSDQHTVTVTIPSGKTFGQIVLDYVPNAPLSSSNTTISGIAADYIYRGSAIEPVPTVTSGGRMLTAGTDYTVSYSGNNSAGTATLTVTGTGNYTGAVTKNYTIRNIALSDFRSLGSDTYEIATTTDLDNLALLVDFAENNCSGLTFRQTADIAYSTTGLGDTGENFATIGGYFNGGDKSFSGTYDGQGHTISGIRLNKPLTNQNVNKNQALFGRTINATIKDVTLTDARITGYRIVGGIIGYCEGSTVQNCLVLNSTVTCGDTYVGALIARNQSGNTFSANYYRGCTVNGTAGATNVGVGGNGVGISYSSDCDGARSVHALTLPDGVTATGENVTINGVTYYASNTTVTLAYTNAAYNATYSVNGNAITGSTFTMPAQDATVTVTTTAVNYSITYDLAGGELPSGQSNPTTYNVETATFTLINPVRDHYKFAGWTGSNGTTPQTTVTIPTGSTGDRSYTANWTPISYTITYNLVGGALPSGQSNPTTYNIETGTFTLINPVRNGYRFDGWTGSNGTTPQTTVTIPTGSTGDLNFTANWTKRYTYDRTTGTLTLNWGEFNKDNKWGIEVEGYYVKSVTATSEVSFTGDCSNLFSGFRTCVSMDLSDVNTSQMTNANSMFFRCYGLTSLNISGWNTEDVTDMNKMFDGCTSLTSLDLSGWNTGSVTDMIAMFRNCYGITSLDLSGWNTEGVTNMSSMFAGCSGLTSLDLSGFNTANVTSMSYMFQYCSGLTSLDISGWNTGNVTDMSQLFRNCSGLDSLDLSGFNTANVTNMNYMFGGCSGLTSLDLSGWNTGNVTNMGTMFQGCSGLDSLDVSGFNTANVIYMDNMFNGCSGLTSLDLSGFNTANVTDMNFMFRNCSSLTSLDLSGFNTEGVTNMGRMFQGCSGLTSLDLSGWNIGNVTDLSQLFCNLSSLTTLNLSGWNIGNVTDMESMFYGCSGLTTLDLSGWNTGNVTNMAYMFYGCSGLTALDLSGWNTGNVTNMGTMFQGCSGLDSLDVSGFNTANVIYMDNMFNGCSGLTSLDLSGFNTANVTTMSLMFYNCSGLTSLDLSSWNTGNVSEMDGTFSTCSGLTSLDLSGWNTGNVIDMSCMFYCCSNLTTIYAGEDWSTAGIKWSDLMFWDCTRLEGGMGTTFSASNPMDKTYARIDGGPSNPGYFTAKSTALRGDVDGNGSVGIGDITALIDYILSGDASDVNVDAADCDQNGTIGISDVTTLIDYILSGTW